MSCRRDDYCSVSRQCQLRTLLWRQIDNVPFPGKGYCMLIKHISITWIKVTDWHGEIRCVVKLSLLLFEVHTMNMSTNIKCTLLWEYRGWNLQNFENIKNNPEAVILKRTWFCVLRIYQHNTVICFERSPVKFVLSLNWKLAKTINKYNTSRMSVAKATTATPKTAPIKNEFIFYQRISGYS